MLLHDLQRASFRGVPFLVPSDEMSEGRKTIDHYYPDANFRYAEDNGGIPPKFKISAILAEPNLPGKLRALRRALTAQGPGTLKHPWCGAQFVQVDGEYSVKRSDKHAGYVEIEIKFLVTGPPQFPGLVSGVAAFVSTLAGSAIAEIFAAFVAEFGDPFAIGSSPGRLPREIAGRVDRLSATSSAAIATVIAEVGEVLETHFGAVSAAPSAIVENAGQLARDAPALASYLTQAMRAPLDRAADPIQAATGVTTTVAATVSDRALVVGFQALEAVASAAADDAAEIGATTLDFANRKTALAILSGYVQAAAFVNLAEAVAVSTYDTADDVERSENLLTNAHESLHSRDLAATVRAALGDVFVAASAVLRDAAVRLPRVVTVPAFNTPASVMAYIIYENRFEPQNHRVIDDRLTTMIRLNLDQTPLLLSGDANVVMRDA